MPRSERDHGSSFRERARRRSRSQALGALDIVVEQLDRALEALEHQDVELATFVIADDDRIDGRYLEVHQGILSLLALQAPVAGDLRLVAALLHVIKHAERMGDQCVNIAKLIPLVGNEPPVVPRAAREGPADGRRRALGGRRGEAGVPGPRRRRSPPTSSRQDREVNRLNKEVFRLAVTVGDDEDTREWAMMMTLVARALERIGDNAVGVGEQVDLRRDRAVPRVPDGRRRRRAGSATRRADAALPDAPNRRSAVTIGL